MSAARPTKDPGSVAFLRETIAELLGCGPDEGETNALLMAGAIRRAEEGFYAVHQLVLGADPATGGELAEEMYSRMGGIQKALKVLDALEARERAEAAQTSATTPPSST